MRLWNVVSGGEVTGRGLCGGDVEIAAEMLRYDARGGQAHDSDISVFSSS